MPDTATPHSAASLRRLAPFAILIAVGIGFVALGGQRYLNFATFAENRAWLCGLVARWRGGAAILYVLLYAAAIALSIPGAALLTIAGGFLFGTWLGGS